jgi:UPF0755 protein
MQARRSRPPRRWVRRSIAVRLGGALGLLLVLSALVLWVAYRWLPLTQSQPSLELLVEPGTLPGTLAVSLRNQGVDVSPWTFWLATRLRGDARRIQSGSYELTAPISLAALLDKLVRSDLQQRELRIVEGWTFRQLRLALERHPDLNHQTLGLSDLDLLRQLGSQHDHPEGWFAPDSYLFTPGASDLSILQRALRQQERLLQAAWARRPQAFPLSSPAQLLTLASIVEKETAREADRPQIAAVFVNRLRNGMRLQSDPTTIYGLGERFSGDLRRDDLRADTPWNTYTRAGLPATPIAMPGRAALAATIDPAPSQALYFVARGDGSSEFSETLAAHNRAVQRWQRRASASVSER